MSKLDSIDIKIINFLQDNARMQIKDIAKEVCLSSPAVSTRIDRLEKEGIIKGYHANVDYDKMGFHILAYINVQIPPENKDTFYKFASEMPNILECSWVTGEFSMHVKSAFVTTKELDEFVTKLQKYGSTRTQIVFSSNVGPRGIKFKDN